MSDTPISIDGELTTLRQANIDPNTLLGRNGVYAIINTLGHKPLHLAQKLTRALDSFEALYGQRVDISVRRLSGEIYDLLHFGLYPEGGNTVVLWLLATPEGGHRRYILHKATTPYDDGYSLLSIRPKATIANYEIPFERHQTSISLAAAEFASGYAERTAGAIALRASRAGSLLSADDSPLVAVRGFELMTAPIAEGGRDSVERELLFRLAELAGLKIKEKTPTVDEIESYDEIMVMTPVGIMSIYSVGEIHLGNIYAHILSKHLKALTREGLAR